MLKRLLSRIGSFVKRRPIVSIVIVVAIAVVGLAVTYETMHMTSAPKFCKLCHPLEGTGALAEYHTWEANIHAANGIECLDCHSKQPGAWGYMLAKMGGLYDVGAEIVLSKERKLELLSRFDGNPEESAKLVKSNICMHCHTDSVNKENREKHWMSFAGVKMRTLDGVINPAFREMYGTPDILQSAVRFGVEPNHAMHINEQNLACADCHTTVSHSGDFRSPVKMETCFTCHDQKRADANLTPVANEDCMTCHVTQVAMQDATAFKEYGVEGTTWSMKDMGCDSCHVDPFVAPTKESCLNCHEEGYDDLLAVFQASFTEQFDIAWDFYIKNISARKTMPEAQRKAFNEYEVMISTLQADGSKGFHNSEYADEVFAHLSDLRDQFIEK